MSVLCPLTIHARTATDKTFVGAFLSFNSIPHGVTGALLPANKSLRMNNSRKQTKISINKVINRSRCTGNKNEIKAVITRPCPFFQTGTCVSYVSVVGGETMSTEWKRKKNGCWSFTSLQQLRSYQNEHRLVTVHNHGDFIVLLPHWEINRNILTLS